MRLPLLALLAITLTACTGDNALKRECPKTCFGVFDISEGVYTEQHAEHIKDRVGIGECKAGIPVCDKSNLNIVACEGEVLPSPEECDGKDNDCDGFTDENLYNILPGYPNPTDNHCLPLGECAKGFEVCRDGNWTCDYPETVIFGDELPEHCDGLDNNCDGLVDNIDLTCTDLMGNEVPCTCYEGPPGSERYGQCKVGFYECRNGEILCLGEIRPDEEVCDEIDNDCNGIVDDTENTLDLKYDIVFVIDASGSMCDEIGAVAGAINVYLDQFSGDPNFQWAIVSMTNWTSRVSIVENFTDISYVQDTLLTLGCSQSGAEASLDALWAVCKKDEDVLRLNWRADATSILFSFTDEEAQTYFGQPTTSSMIINECVDNGVLPFQWSLHPNDFQNIVESSGGEHFILANSWQQILEDLNSVVSKLCID